MHYSIEDIIAKVKRLCDCPKCARVQREVLRGMNRDKEANSTMRLGSELEDLLHARKNQKQSKIDFHAKRAAEIRFEIEADDDGGWVYGSTPGLKGKQFGPVKRTAPGLKWKEVGLDEPMIVSC